MAADSRAGLALDLGQALPGNQAIRFRQSLPLWRNQARCQQRHEKKLRGGLINQHAWKAPPRVRPPFFQGIAAPLLLAASAATVMKR